MNLIGISEFEYNRSIKLMNLNSCVGIDFTIIPQSTQDKNKFQQPHRHLFVILMMAQVQFNPRPVTVC